MLGGSRECDHNNVSYCAEVAIYHSRLLARRLYTRRHLSLEQERHVLQQLGLYDSPQLSLCSVMLDDVKSSTSMFQDFKVSAEVFVGVLLSMIA